MSARVLVFCNGGVVQSVVTDSPDVEVTVIDYETDGSTGETDVDGDPCEINRSHIIDPVTVEKYLGPGKPARESTKVFVLALTPITVGCEKRTFVFHSEAEARKQLADFCRTQWEAYRHETLTNDPLPLLPDNDEEAIRAFDKKCIKELYGNSNSISQFYSIKEAEIPGKKAGV